MSLDPPFSTSLTGVEGRILFYQLCYLIFFIIFNSIYGLSRDIHKYYSKHYARRQGTKEKWRSIPLGLRQKAGNERIMA